jgi:hypothetical protein
VAACLRMWSPNALRALIGSPCRMATTVRHSWSGHTDLVVGQAATDLLRLSAGKRDGYGYGSGSTKDQICGHCTSGAKNGTRHHVVINTARKLRPRNSWNRAGTVTPWALGFS